MGRNKTQASSMMVSLAAIVWGLLPHIAAAHPIQAEQITKPEQLKGWNSVEVSVSRYVNWLHQPDADEISLRTGCEQGASSPGYVFLGLGKQREGGATAFGWDGRMKSYREIEHGMLKFAEGLEKCAKSGEWNLVVMTSNYHLNDPVAAAAFGSEWALLVESLRSHDGFSHVSFLGGSDIEPSWGSPAAAKAWVDAYAAGTDSVLVTGPSADGCPTDNSRSNCNNGWSVADLSYVAWGASPGAVVLPQIYTPSGTMARQWAHLAEVAVSSGFTPLFGGSLTQHRACKNRGCNSTDITPQEAYRQLAVALHDVGLLDSFSGASASDIGWG